MFKAKHEDKKEICDLLCGAFDTNKSVNFIAKQDTRRKERIRILMEHSFELCYRYGAVYWSDDRNACALVIFPENKKTSFSFFLRDLNLLINCIGVERVFAIDRRSKKIKANYPDGLFYYLYFFGVRTDVQHQGSGSALLKEIIQDSEKMKRDIYLETSMTVNVPWYEKRGFEVVKEIDVGYPLWMMKHKVQNTETENRIQ